MLPPRRDNFVLRAHGSAGVYFRALALIITREPPHSVALRQSASRQRREKATEKWVTAGLSATHARVSLFRV